MNRHLVSKSTWLLVGLLIAAAIQPETPSKADEPAQSVKPAADSMLGNEAGDVRDDNGLSMKLVWCPSGFVTMEQVEVIANQGPKITPVRVFLTRGYWIGKYEVTQAEWKKVMATEPWTDQPFLNVGDDVPASYVSWNEAMEFCLKLTDQERKAGRLAVGWEYTLPTEAQWERACRARTETVFSFGDDESKLGEYAWYIENAGLIGGQKFAHRVGQKKPNPWGLFDLHGNVWEWCRDYYSERLPGGRDPEIVERADSRVVRGGSWYHAVEFCRSRTRQPLELSLRAIMVGFRVALSPVPPVK